MMLDHQGTCEKCGDPNGSRRYKCYLTCLAGFQMKYGAADVGILCEACFRPKCRCGWNGQGEHKCHRCGRKPGEPYMVKYPPRVAAIVKDPDHESIGCADCIEEFRKTVEAEEARLSQQP